MLTRRSLLLASLSAATMADIAEAQQHAHSAAATTNATLRYLTAADAPEIEALAAQIIPSDDGTPGAKEAGCIHFIDRALETFDRDQRVLYRTGLAATQEKRLELFPQSKSLAALPPAEAIAVIKAIEETDFFKLLRTHTIMGFLAPPQWGGNRNHAGWTHIHLEHDKMSFQPPFGYYDGQKE